MADGPPTVRLATRDNGLVDCCDDQSPQWYPVKATHADEGDFSIEEAEEIGGVFVWETWTDGERERNEDTFREWAEANGLKARCRSCDRVISPTLATLMFGHDAADE